MPGFLVDSFAESTGSIGLIGDLVFCDREDLEGVVAEGRIELPTYGL